jgi:replicative DNA helicase
MQVLGCLVNHPNLFDRSDKYTFNVDDFGENFYKIIFGAVNNLKLQGMKKIEVLDIDNYLSSRPSIYKVFNDNKGAEYINEVTKIADVSKFDYYYNRMKKMTLLRMYMNYGVDITWLYNPGSLDLKLKQQQEDWIDANDINTIASAIDDKINEIKSQYLNSLGNNGVQAGENIFELVQKFKETPEVGIPMYGPLINTITRGARLKKFYLRSAPSGVGKSRMGVADICNFGCNEIYDLFMNSWVKNGTSEPSLFITTEQEVDEIQTMMLAFLSAVPEDNILNGKYADGEEARVLKAAEIITKSPIWIEELPDFCLDDVENTIRKHVIDNGVKYVCFDYIHTSLKILEEITRKTGGIKLREDNILYMLAIRLKDLCNELGIFLVSSTQLNGEWENKRDGNQNLLRGAKAIADKIDFGMIALPVTDDDLKCLETLLSGGSIVQPNVVMHIYKNRRGKYKSVKLWCSADLGICRVTPLFLTDNGYQLIPVEDFNIVVEDKNSLNFDD